MVKAPAIAWRSGGDGDRERGVMETGNPAEAPAARDPNGRGRATTASQAESTEPRVLSRAGISVGGPVGNLDWEEIKATSRRILRQSLNRKRCWKRMKRRAEEMMRMKPERSFTDLAGSVEAGGDNGDISEVLPYNRDIVSQDLTPFGVGGPILDATSMETTVIALDYREILSLRDIKEKEGN